MGRTFRPSSAHGYSLPELLMTVAVTATIMAIAVPVARNMTDAIKLGQATREVERELQSARLKAVQANRRIRVRFACPAAGQFRTIEVTGVTLTDNASNRCDQTTYPYPGPRDDNRATPQHDGPVRHLESLVTVSATNFEFSPNGTTSILNSNNTTTAITTPVTITISRRGVSKAVTVNALGKIQLQQ